MDQARQQNAAMVEQSTAASRVLREETDRLAAMIGSFTVSAKNGEPLGRPAQRAGSTVVAPAKAAATRAPAPTVRRTAAGAR
jgi:hypothetical protein